MGRDPIIRLKKYEHFVPGTDTRETYTVQDKKEVFVCLHLGCEPLKITDKSQYLDVEDIILKMAAAIRKARKEKRLPNKGKHNVKGI